ncbi:MAG: hypothetical protein ABJV04_15905 [Aliiglaciecola sp.]|uniref:hypothetical protein n=1 Tax=Aliiglaciecola sp. TaxID=1872441 RepID=UPI003298CA31
MPKRKIIELSAEGAEIALKKIIDEGVLKDIPVVGSLVKFLSIGQSIRDSLYIEKLHSFIYALNEVPSEKKEEFISEVKKRKHEVENLIQKIILVIETQTDIDKSQIIANFFVSYLDGVMGESEFRRALDITGSYFLDDINKFVGSPGDFGFKRRSVEDLENDGLHHLIGSPLIGFDKSTPEDLINDGWKENTFSSLFEITNFGLKFKKAYHHGARLRNNDG